MTREVTVTIQTTSAGVTVNPGDTRTIVLYRDGDPVPAVNGIPAGGTTGQVLAKASDDDRDVEWASTGGAAVWGGIGGTLSNQTDLQAALDGKLDDISAGTADTIVTANAAGTILSRAAFTIATLLATARDRATHTGTQLAATISNFTAAVQALFGTTAGTICEGNDSRLSDARAPTAHDQGSDTITTNLLTISGTTHTADAADDGKVYRFTNASGCTVTIPDSLAAGWSVGWLQVGNAQSTVAVSGSMVLSNRQGHTKTAGQYAAGNLTVQAANSVYLSGDTST